MKYLKTKLFSIFLTLSVITTLMCMLSSSCSQNANTPEYSRLSILLNGKDITETMMSSSDVITINLDAETTTETELAPNGYLEIILKHYDDDDNELPIGATFTSPNIALTSRGNASATLNLSTSSLPLGVYTITCQSNAGKSFNKNFDFYIFSSVTSIGAKYTIQDPISGVEYDNNNNTSAKEGTIYGTDGVLYLATNTTYNFEVFSTNSSRIGALDYDTYGTEEDGRPTLRWSGSDITKRNLITHGNKTPDDIVEKFQKHNDTSALPYFEITLKDTQKKIKRYVILKQYAQAEIVESNGESDKTKYLLLSLSEGQKSYTINVKGTVSDGALQYALPKGTLSKDNTTPPAPSSGWSTGGITSYGEYNNNPSPYFDLFFDGTNKQIKITPYQDTVTEDSSRNIDFYFHLKDAYGNYLGYWKILVGGIVESIKLDTDKIEGSPQKSGVIKAEVIPHSATCNVLWYVSEKPYSSQGSHRSAEPSEDRTIKNMMSMLPSPTYFYEKSLNKTYTINMRGRNGSSGDSATNEYYNTTSASPGTVDGVSTLVYTLGSVSGKAYLNALVCRVDTLGNVDPINDYKLYKSIPITISSNGEVAIRSINSVSSSIIDASSQKEYNLEKYVDENNNLLSLPTRTTGQEYPLTLEDGKYGSATRSFYFPHNSSSTIDIDIFGIDEEIQISPSAEADKLFTITKNEKSNGVILTITPVWYTYWKDFMVGSVKSNAPPMKKGASVEGYGKFSDYIGVGYINFNLAGSTGTIRIVIYDNNVYEENKKE